MNRSKFGMRSLRSCVALVAALNIMAVTNAGPLGPLPMQNVTSADMGIKEDSCALGDVVYMPGDEFPGSSPCERCVCAVGGVRCARTECAPRPGCKALHRPDHCCPTYQCECEQEGRVYGNGEKLVDPRDPCRVCYCQGGEVVCRRIACFVRDDCTPRLVPGRCCPEYDNCPLRGVTALPGMTTSPSSILASSSKPSAAPAAPAAPQEVIEPKITIKEITPVSEIPVMTDVKIKEILPSPSIEVAEYSSSKSPLITREATSERSSNSDFETPKLVQEVPSVVEVYSSPETVSTEETKPLTDNKNLETPAPSKISLSTQDSINSEIYPSNVPMISTMGSPSIIPDTRPAAITTKAPMVEEEDTSLFDHNPAFPPLPDDLSVLSNHGDEIVPEPSADTDHIPVEPVPEDIVASVTSTSVPEFIEPLTTTEKHISDAAVSTSEAPTELSTSLTELTSTSGPVDKENPTVKLRSAIPTEIISASSEQEVARDSHEKDYTKTSTTRSNSSTDTSVPFIATDASKKSEEITTEEPEIPIERVSFLTTVSEPEIQSTTQKFTESPGNEGSSITPQDQTTNSIAKSNIATEVTSQTELSSLPIETSDQNPHEASENVSKETIDISTSDPLSDGSTTTDKTASSEVITFAKADSRAIENIETTEFILTSFGSSESSTDAVEIIKIPGDSDKNAAIIDGTDGNKNALTDLIKLVSDVASMSDHADPPQVVHQGSSTGYSNSEELIPVNAGYKSKNSNFNQNSITEVPFKSKSATLPNKLKVAEIDEDEDESAGITDSPAPDDKVEPTTRRPIIDNVSDDMSEVKSDKKDIEIITQSYVPTINKRPTKVIKKDENSEPNEMPQEDAPAATYASAETVTERATTGGEDGVPGSVEASGAAEARTGAPPSSQETGNATLSVEQ